MVAKQILQLFSNYFSNYSICTDNGAVHKEMEVVHDICESTNVNQQICEPTNYKPVKTFLFNDGPKFETHSQEITFILFLFNPPTPAGDTNFSCLI